MALAIRALLALQDSAVQGVGAAVASPHVGAGWKEGCTTHTLQAVRACQIGNVANQKLVLYLLEPLSK